MKSVKWKNHIIVYYDKVSHKALAVTQLCAILVPSLILDCSQPLNIFLIRCWQRKGGVSPLNNVNRMILLCFEVIIVSNFVLM